MISWLNRHSYLFTSALAMGVAWIIGARFGGLWPTVAVAGTGIGMALAQRTLRRGQSDVAALDEIQSGPASSQPTLLFIFSDSCGACLASQRIVNGLEQELAGTARVVRLNIAEPVGFEAHQRYGTTMVPAIILLDANGVQLYRTEGKLPKRMAILNALDEIG